MELSAAIAMIERGIGQTAGRQVWADLGAGSGLFTRALSALLPDNSMIFAVDMQYAPSQQIGSLNPSIAISCIKADFTAPLELPACNGILMANALHFVQDKPPLLRRIKSMVSANPQRIILVEYDSNEANAWVPYPIAYKNLQQLCNAHHLGAIEQLSHAESRYQRGGMYSAVLTW